MKVAVVAHVFYPEIWPELLSSIRNVVSAAKGTDVFVTVTGPACGQEPRIRDELPTATVFRVENRGYDVAPFLFVLDRLDLTAYDVIVKLHTKRDTECCWLNFRRFKGSDWRKELLSFCSSPQAAGRTIGAFAKHRRLGMVAGMKLFDPCGAGMSCDFSGADGVLRSLGIEPRRHCALYGTMFAVRASLLRPLQGRFTPIQFAEPESVVAHRSYGLAGDIELAFAMLVDAQGYYVGSGRLADVAARAVNGIRAMIFRCLRWASDHVRGRCLRA